MITLLPGHVSPETAYELRTAPSGPGNPQPSRYWVEPSKDGGRGVVEYRDHSGTWGSRTYCHVHPCAVAMYLTADGAVMFASIDRHTSRQDAATWDRLYGPACDMDVRHAVLHAIGVAPIVACEDAP